MITMAINKSNEMGLQDVVLQEEANDAKERLKTEQSIAKQNQLKSFIDRSEFYINEPNIYKVQKGNGLFKNSLYTFLISLLSCEHLFDILLSFS